MVDAHVLAYSGSLGCSRFLSFGLYPTRGIAQVSQRRARSRQFGPPSWGGRHNDAAGGFFPSASSTSDPHTIVGPSLFLSCENGIRAPRRSSRPQQTAALFLALHPSARIQNSLMHRRVDFSRTSGTDTPRADAVPAGAPRNSALGRRPLSAEPAGKLVGTGGPPWMPSTASSAMSCERAPADAGTDCAALRV